MQRWEEILINIFGEENVILVAFFKWFIPVIGIATLGFGIYLIAVSEGSKDTDKDPVYAQASEAATPPAENPAPAVQASPPPPTPTPPVVDLTQTEEPMMDWGSVVVSTLFFITYIIWCVISLIVVRVILECIIVVFDIAQTLRSIETGLNPQQSHQRSKPLFFNKYATPILVSVSWILCLAVLALNALGLIVFLASGVLT